MVSQKSGQENKTISSPLELNAILHGTLIRDPRDLFEVPLSISAASREHDGNSKEENVATDPWCDPFFRRRPVGPRRRRRRGRAPSRFRWCWKPAADRWVRGSYRWCPWLLTARALERQLVAVVVPSRAPDEYWGDRNAAAAVISEVRLRRWWWWRRRCQQQSQRTCYTHAVFDDVQTQRNWTQIRPIEWKSSRRSSQSWQYRGIYRFLQVPCRCWWRFRRINRVLLRRSPNQKGLALRLAMRQADCNLAPSSGQPLCFDGVVDRRAVLMNHRDCLSRPTQYKRSTNDVPMPINRLIGFYCLWAHR